MLPARQTASLAIAAAGASALAAYALTPPHPALRRWLLAAGAGGLAFAVSSSLSSDESTPSAKVPEDARVRSDPGTTGPRADAPPLVQPPGSPAKRTTQEALDEDLLGAAKGNPKAQFQLGVRYEHGRGVVKDAKLALEWFRKAAEQGHADALNNLGAIYEKGALVEKDEKKAVEYFKESAKQGSANGHFNLALCYIRGHAVVRLGFSLGTWGTSS